MYYIIKNGNNLKRGDNRLNELMEKSMTELRELAKSMDIKSYYKFKKDELASEIMKKIEEAKIAQGIIKPAPKEEKRIEDTGAQVEMEENQKNRWYDKDPRMSEILDLIKDLSDEDQEELAVNLIKYINIIRKNRKELENTLSIGKSRVLGLYKAYNKRRWYDKSSSLMSAMNILATLAPDDCKSIVEALIMSMHRETE
jgi:hypothetical protein